MPKQQFDNSARKPKPTPLHVIGSVLAAAIGVQSSKNRERDFKHGKASTHIIADIGFTALFGLTVFTVVKLVLSNAGM